ncbi:polysaccharide pyruvyl transferase family protein [Flavobacterium sp.]|uniref:polysaccharide pyruvyl transferase family protein n=1 Tax=Flavobacterium sp. TaxID=239 RepID=UPI0028BEF616|nr:polysaccharide pyruvyl transferase family protein [Flavobacterium sp.]
MREGLMTIEFTDGRLNIGDYVQSIAAKQFLKDKNNFVYVDREHLDSYDGEELKLIFNGWFLMRPENFPPSPKIKPIIVSHHLNVTVQNKFDNNPKVLAFYKANEPVGCRDFFTLDFMKKHGIEAYYTGCLTLTLGNTYSSDENSDKVYFVDPRYKKHKGFAAKTETILIALSKYNTINTIRKRFKKENNWKSWYKTVQFYKSYSQIFTDEVLMNAEYVKHFIPAKQFKNEDEIFAFGEDLLRKYAKANYVVTSRIHCALPSVSMGTPTLYIDIPDDNDVSDCRLNGIKEYFHVVENHKGKLSTGLLAQNEKFQWKVNFENKKDFIPIKENLERIVRERM